MPLSLFAAQYSDFTGLWMCLCNLSVKHSLLQTGPDFSRLDRLLPIGPRAKGGPTLRLQTYAFNRKCLCSAGAGPTVFLGVGPVAIENKNELRRLLTPSIIIIRSLTMVIVFLQRVA